MKKKKVEQSFFTNDDPLCRKFHEIYKNPEPINEFNEFSGYKINIQELFLYTSNEVSKIKSTKQYCLQWYQKNMKTQGISLTKDMKGLHTKP